MTWCRCSAGVEEQGMRMRAPQEPGRSGRLPEGHTGKGIRFTQAPGPRSLRFAATGSERGALQGYCRAKETKCGGTGVQKSESSIVCAGQRTGQGG